MKNTKPNVPTGKIILLHNYHPRSDMPDITDNLETWSTLSKNAKQLLLSTANSQCRVFKYIQQRKSYNAGISVLMENSQGSARISDTQLLYEEDIIVNLKEWQWLISKFPQPLDCNNLNIEQSGWLSSAKFGARNLVGLSGYTTDSNYLPPFSSDFFDDSPYSFLDVKRHKIYQAREFLTLLRAWQLMTKNPSEDVIVSYGYSHPFHDVAKCITEMKLPIEIQRLYKPTPFTPEDAKLYKQVLKIRPTPNCTELIETARAHGYPNYPQDENGQPMFFTTKKNTYIFSVEDTAYALTKSAGYVLIPSFLYDICLKRGCSQTQAKIIAELVKVTMMCYEHGPTSLVTTAMASMLCISGLPYQKAQVLSNMLSVLLTTTLLMITASDVTLFKTGMNIVHNLLGGLIGYWIYEGIKALTSGNDKQSTPPKKITLHALNTILQTHHLLKRYRFGPGSHQKISKYFRNKRFSPEVAGNKIYAASKYRRTFGFFQNWLPCARKAELYIPDDAFNKGAGAL
jgi:hypothetical protein